MHHRSAQQDAYLLIGELFVGLFAEFGAVRWLFNRQPVAGSSEAPTDIVILGQSEPTDAQSLVTRKGEKKSEKKARKKSGPV